MKEYYGFEPEGEILTLYRLEKNEEGLMISLEGATATQGWADKHEVLELLGDDLDLLTQAEAEQTAKKFGVAL